MSKVIMDLKEYDELITKLRKYERLVNQMTTPVIDKWNYEYFLKNPSSTLQVHGQIRDSELIEFLKEEVINNVYNSEELFKKLGYYEPEFDISYISLFRVRHEITEDVTEVEEG